MAVLSLYREYKHQDNILTLNTYSQKLKKKKPSPKIIVKYFLMYSFKDTHYPENTFLSNFFCHIPKNSSQLILRLLGNGMKPIHRLGLSSQLLPALKIQIFSLAERKGIKTIPMGI